jgi:DNA N-6-adenine-methyltransferase (Dam)
MKLTTETGCGCFVAGDGMQREVMFSTIRDDGPWDQTGAWSTPPALIDRVMNVFGCAIELDPCSDPVAQQTIMAARYYTHEGLIASWRSPALYMNPPYGRSIIEPWIDRFMLAIKLPGYVAQAALLIPARTDTTWFQPIWDLSAICFLRGRLRFGGRNSSAPFPSVVGYHGPYVSRFVREFSQIGHCILRNS